MEEEVKIEEINMGMKKKDFKFSSIFGIRLKLKSIKVRFLIGGLLIAPEGYSRAKSI